MRCKCESEGHGTQNFPMYLNYKKTFFKKELNKVLFDHLYRWGEMSPRVDRNPKEAEPRLGLWV